MALFEWTPALAVGNKDIDSDHRHLIDLINKLFFAISNGKGNVVIGEIVDELIRYTETHFQREEALMQQIGYGSYEAHKAAHDAFVLEVRKLQARFVAGQVLSPMNVFSFLGDWLFKHIQACDVALGAASQAVH